MSLDLDIVDILTDEQKLELQNLYFNKVKKAIEKADFTQEVKKPVETWLEDQYVEEYIDMDEIGELLTKQVKKALEKSFEVK